MAMANAVRCGGHRGTRRWRGWEGMGSHLSVEGCVRMGELRLSLGGENGSGVGGDFGAEATFGKVGGDGGVGGGFGGVAEEVWCRGGAGGGGWGGCGGVEVDEGVAAFKDAERAEGVELRGGAGEAGAGIEERSGAGGEEALVEGVEAAVVGGEAEGDVLAAEARFELLEAGGAGAEGAVEGGLGAEGELVEVLGVALEGVEGAGEDGVGGEAGEELAGAEEVVAVGAEEAAGEAVEAVGDTVLGGGDELGGGGGCGGAEVGGGVGEDGVGGVADAGDDGDGAGGDGAAEGLVVEAVEVFPGAAAAGDEDDIDDAGVEGMGGPAHADDGAVGMNGAPGFVGGTVGEPADAGGYFAGAVGALDGRRIDQQVDGGVAAAADLDDIAERGAVKAGDDADAAREGGEGTLVVEDAFAAELFFELLDGGEEGAEAGLLHGFGDELHLTAGLVDAERAGDADGVAVFGAEAEELGLAAEEDDGELGVAVFEREVAVTAGGGAPVGDFAFDGDAAVGALDEGADAADELGDGEHLRDVLRDSCAEGGWVRGGYENLGSYE
jgi:hypothetical protein